MNKEQTTTKPKTVEPPSDCRSGSILCSTVLFGRRITIRRPREPDEDWLTMESHAILDRAAEEHQAKCFAPLFSGGHDSLCAVHVTAQHWAAARPFVVYHIDTGTGAQETRRYVEHVCRSQKWELAVLKSPDKADHIENLVRRFGCLGPGMHQIAYASLKERCVESLVNDLSIANRPLALVTGARAEESARRMGHAAEIKRGRGQYKNGNLRAPRQLWVSPCLHWTPQDQAVYMDEWGLPVNRVKVATGKSGECNCGCYARLGEREKIDQYTPDVGAMIDEWQRIAAESGKPAVWGKAPSATVPKVAPGPLCVGCLFDP